MGLDPAGRTPTLSGTPAGGARSSMGCRRRCCSPGWDAGPWSLAETERYVQLAGGHPS